MLPDKTGLFKSEKHNNPAKNRGLLLFYLSIYKLSKIKRCATW